MRAHTQPAPPWPQAAPAAVTGRRPAGATTALPAGERRWTR